MPVPTLPLTILCIGGGPAGLYFGLLMKQRNPACRIVVIERNRADDGFGWGVVLSEQTLDRLAAADERTAAEIVQASRRWDDIDVHFKGETVRSRGHAFCAIGRTRLLHILQRRCIELGVELLFESDVTDDRERAARYRADLVIAADGLNSGTRSRYAASFVPDIDVRKCRFIWLGTAKPFSAFTFAFEETAHGWFQAHAYRYDDAASTFIVETPDQAWHATGLDRMRPDESIAFCERLFARHLDGHRLLANGGRADWLRFPRIACRRWVHWNEIGGRRVPVVLIGDAAHSAHFSIGSGTRLALEDAIDLAQRLAAHDDGNLDAALDAYEKARTVEVLKLQSAARNSMEWFENVARYARMEAPQFAYALFTRSQRVSHENLRLRDTAYVAGYEAWFAARAAGAAGVANTCAVPPMLTPLRLRGVTLKNRIMVSPMAQYSAEDGLVGDYHLAHLGARALGGAGLVCAEMTAVSADARITPGCPGLYAVEHGAAWKRIVDFVHTHTDAKIAIQLGHAGAKGSTQRAWDGIDLPLEAGNWPLLSASPQQYLDGVSQLAREATHADMERIKADFVRAAQAAAEAGFDWLELHCAHGYLLSSFISPLTNRRQDEYGGALESRCRYPLDVFRAVRAAWPQDRPISVRISAHDWVDGGTTPDDAVEIAKLFKAAGADIIDCSSGQISKRERPAYGRMYQTPFADRIRHEAGIPTIAVGAISEADQVNAIIAAGRADLCAIGRPHLANPAWTLTEAAKIGCAAMPWPRQYHAGKTQLERALAPERGGS